MPALFLWGKACGRWVLLVFRFLDYLCEGCVRFGKIYYIIMIIG